MAVRQQINNTFSTADFCPDVTQNKNWQKIFRIMLLLMEFRRKLSGNDFFMSVVELIEYDLDIKAQFLIMHIIKV